MAKPKKTDALTGFRSIRSETSHEKVRFHEDRAASVFGGKRHAGSGAFQGLKSDASSDDFQIECKRTDKDSLSFKVQWLDKISTEALGVGKIPAMHIELQNCEHHKRWVVIPEQIFQMLLNKRDEDDI